jgi:hypothetical protein
MEQHRERERLDGIATGTPDICFESAKNRGLLNNPGWEFLNENNEEEDASIATSEGIVSQFDEDKQYESDNGGDGNSSDSDYHNDSREDKPIICVRQDPR